MPEEVDKCEKCGTEIKWYNKSWNSKLCKKCFSKPVNDVFKGLFGLLFLVIIIVVIHSFSSGNSPTSDVTSPTPLKAEVSPMGGTLYQYSVTNRNNYPWHNVKIIVDAYYSCNGALDTLDPGSQTIVILTPACTDSNGNHDFNQNIQSLKVQADEGSEYFTLQ
jgi:hypothetical protein